MDPMMLMQLLSGLGGGMGMGGMPAMAGGGPQPPMPVDAGGPGAMMGGGDMSSFGQVPQAPPMQAPAMPTERPAPAEPPGMFQRLLGGLTGGGPKNGSSGMNPALMTAMLGGLGRSPQAPRQPMALPVAGTQGHGMPQGGAFPSTLFPGRRM